MALFFFARPRDTLTAIKQQGETANDGIFSEHTERLFMDGIHSEQERALERDEARSLCRFDASVARGVLSRPAWLGASRTRVRVKPPSSAAL